MIHEKIAAVRPVPLVAAIATLALAGCGSSSSASSDHRSVWTATAVQLCLEQAGASVNNNDPTFVVGDSSAGTFQVGIDGSYADVAFAADESGAEETEELASGMLESFGVDGDGSHHRGNVAYWQLDESDAPIQAIEACLNE